jgi:hypothetical protein
MGSDATYDAWQALSFWACGTACSMALNEMQKAIWVVCVVATGWTWLLAWLYEATTAQSAEHSGSLCAVLDFQSGCLYAGLPGSAFGCWHRCPLAGHPN